jgi:quinol monooxygenase YgiN
MHERRLIPLSVFVFLHVAALSSFAGPADPTPNHFQLVEVFANQQAFDAHVSAQHTVNFRNDIQPFIGAPYDERLYHFANQ